MFTSYTFSRSRALGFLGLLPLDIFYCSTLAGVCQEVFSIFLKSQCAFTPPYLLLTFSIVAYSQGFVKRFYIFFSEFLSHSRAYNVSVLLTLSIVALFALLVKREFQISLKTGQLPSCHTHQRSRSAIHCSLLILSIIADCPRITIDKITKLREKIFFTFSQLFS